MKKLLTLLVLLPHVLFSQVNPIVESNKNYVCSFEQKIDKDKSKRIITLNAQTSKEAIDPIQYLLNTDLDDVSKFLEDRNQWSKTDIYSDQNAMKVVQYFKDEIIQKIDPELSDQNPSKFIKYFRAYDVAAWYNPEITLYEPYIDKLFESIRVLYAYEPYWEKTEALNGFRWNATLLMDIEGHRSKIYDAFIVALKNSGDDFIGARFPQIDHLNAISSIVWRAFMNNDTAFITKFLNDQYALNLYFDVIDNDLLYGDIEYVLSNFITPVGIILKRALENSNYDSSFLFNMVSERFNATKFGENKHIFWISSLINVNYDFGIDMNKIKSDYLDFEFNKTYVYDDGSIKIHTSLDSTRVQSIYLSMRNTRSNFFKLTGNTDPLGTDTNDVINLYIFSNNERYSTLGGFLFNIPTNNGGIYIEDYSAIYTFDRDSDYLPINFLVDHEYVHYLDGRYNIEGTYGELDFYDWDTGRYVFWVEGLASFAASARPKTGFGIAYSNAYQITQDVNRNSTITLKESIRTSYNNSRMYPYSEAAWGFLYTYLHPQLLELLELVKNNNVQEYFNKLDLIAYNQTFEPLFQQYLIEIKNKYNSGSTNHDPLRSYNFNDNKIENDSIQFSFEKLGLSNITIKRSYETPHEFATVNKDTIVSSLKIVNEYLEGLVKMTDTIAAPRYSGYDILTAQIDRYERVGDSYKVYYSLELPVNGSFSVVEEPVDPDPVDPDPVDPVDPVDPDPVDPVDPEPIITSIILYPNPTVSEINVINLPESSQIYIYDTTGKIRYMSNHTKGDFRLDVSNFTNGFYILSYVLPGISRGSIKFIKR